nr:unnamed protein product [Haemonchus contortus]
MFCSTTKLRKLGFVPITTPVQMRRLILLCAVLVCAESYITYRGQKTGQAQRVVHIPVNPNALMFCSQLNVVRF